MRLDDVRLAAEQVRRDFLAGIDQTLHRADRLVERFAVLACEFDFHNALDAFRSDDDGHADIHFLDAVFAVEIGGARQHALLVLQKTLDRKSTRLNSSHTVISYAVFCLKKKTLKKYTKVI